MMENAEPQDECFPEQIPNINLLKRQGHSCNCVPIAKGSGHFSPLCALEISSKLMGVAHYNNFDASFQMFSFRQLWLNFERDIKICVLISVLLPLAEVTAILIC